MGIIEFFLLVVITAGLGYLAILGLAKLSPDHPKILDFIVWFVVVVIVLVALANAMGIGAIDPRIPRIR